MNAIRSILVRKLKQLDVTAHYLRLGDYYFLIVQADIPGQITNRMKHGITHKGVVEINSLQVYF